MSKLAIQYVSPEDVRPYAGNARTHSKRQIRQIADSIQRFGFANPVLVSGNRDRDPSEPNELISTVLDEVARDYFRHAIRKQRPPSHLTGDGHLNVNAKAGSG